MSASVAPPIRLSLLGGVDLRAADGTEIQAVVRQPKRLALLAYLLLAAEGRWLRRDALLGLFWPELDESHARAALRRALHYLRRELGAETLPGRGEEELGVDRERIWCDVLAFRDALRSGHRDAALALYGGDLLEGMYVAGAPEVERWVDNLRGALRREAAEAAWSLVEHLPDRALELAGRAVALAPDDETGVRRYMTLLEAEGQLAQALHVYEQFGDALRRELDLAPSPETRQVAERLRAALTGAQARTALLATALPSAPGVPRPLLVAVCPFSVEAESRLEYLGTALMQLLSATLDAAGPIHTVEPGALQAALRRGGLDGADPEVGRRIARHFAAGCFLVGGIVGAGGRLRAVAALYGSDGALQTRVEASVPSEDELFELADGLSRRLLEHLGASPKAPLGGSAARTTPSLSALKAYLAGEHELAEGRYLDAVAHFQAAAVTDPEFALAHYRLAGSLAGVALVAEARAADAEAFRHRSRLSDHDRRLVEAQHAWLAGSMVEAERHYASLVSSYPESLEGWFRLGDTLYHGNPDRGRSITEASLAFERALGLDPAHVGSLTHLARIRAQEGRHSEVGTLIAKVLEASPATDHAFAMLALRAFSSGSAGDQETVLRDLEGAKGFAILNAFVDVAVNAGNPAGAVRLGQATVAVARSDEFRALCRLGLACALTAAGEHEAAHAELSAARDLAPWWSLETRAVLACLPGAAPDREQLVGLRAELARAGGLPPPMTPGPLRLLRGLQPQLRVYLEALVGIRLGDTGGALEAAERLNELDVPAGALAEAEALQRVLQAEQMAGAGDPTEALARLDVGRRSVWYQVAAWSPVLAGTHERLLRARLLLDLGRPGEARPWLDTLAQRSPFELLGLPPARTLRERAGLTNHGIQR